MFVKAETLEPDAVAEALALIGQLYEVEAHIRDSELDGEQALAYRAEYARVGVDAFFAWCHEQCQRIELIPSNPLAKALQYARAKGRCAFIWVTRAWRSTPTTSNELAALERHYRDHENMKTPPTQDEIESAPMVPVRVCAGDAVLRVPEVWHAVTPIHRLRRYAGGSFTCRGELSPTMQQRREKVLAEREAVAPARNHWVWS